MAEYSQHSSSLRRFYRRYKRMPSFSEMLGLFGVKSKQTVSRIVDFFETTGMVSQDDTGRLVPGPAFHGLRMVGEVKAGFPSPAEEELVDVMALDEYLIGNHDATFMLRVSGDSMIDAGIHPDDIVLMERGRNPRNGDIVIAEVDHEWTMKYFEQCKGRVRLIAANERYGPIEPREELNIAGVVTAVIRRYS